MLTSDQKKDILNEVAKVLNTYNNGNFTQCTIDIDLDDATAFADGKAILTETRYELSYTFRGETKNG